MISPIQNTLSALSAYNVKMGVHAHNLANANTDGFKRYRADLISGSNGAVKAHVSRVNTPGYRYVDPISQEEKETSNVDFMEEMIQTLPITIGYKANLTMLSMTNKLIGSVLDLFA